MKIIRALSLLVGVILLISCNISNDNAERGQDMRNRKRIILLGASVGKSWNLKEFPQRMKIDNYVFESIAFYEYDKTEALEEILMRPKRKFRLTKTYIKGFFEPAPQRPDVIILKECAAYFPGDLILYKELIKKWVQRLHGTNYKVVLATVVPVTPERNEKKRGQIESIREFNDWVREYTANEHITLLDLEEALRQDNDGRFLREDLTSGDGLHLNKKAYDILDKLLQETILAKF
jgi:hypothetical protein